MSGLHQTLLIAGHRIGGPCDQSVGKELARNPFTGDVVGTYAEGGWSELSTACLAARDAAESWRRSSAGQRAELLSRTADLIAGRKEELARLAAIEIGKPVALARAELARAELTFRLSASGAPSLRPEPLGVEGDPRSGLFEVFEERGPRGVVLAVTPYNWPFNLVAHKLGPAIAAGNAVVLKPSPHAALSTLAFAELVHEAGAPSGLINTWCGHPSVLNRALKEEKVDYLSFTGSDQVGWMLRDAHPRLPMTLELGGDASCFVSESADCGLAAAELALSAFAYAGQVCISAQHVWVQSSVYERFLPLLISETLALRAGDPLGETTVVGPVINADSACRIESWIEEALAGGAARLTGGPREGNLIPPTVLAGVPEGATIRGEEVFGPVLCVHRVPSLTAAIDQIRLSKYGLMASIYSQSESEIEAFSASLQVGGIVVNGPPSTRFDAMPYGGRKRSGAGLEGVRYAIRELSVPRARIHRKNTNPE